MLKDIEKRISDLSSRQVRELLASLQGRIDQKIDIGAYSTLEKLYPYHATLNEDNFIKFLLRILLVQDHSIGQWLRKELTSDRFNSESESTATIYTRDGVFGIALGIFTV